MNKVKRWRKCWISALNVYRHEYMQSYAFTQNIYNTQTQIKISLFNF